MKQIILMMFVGLISLASCAEKSQKESKTTSTPVADKMEAVATAVKEDSEYYFNKSMTALQSMKNNEAASDLERAITNLKKDVGNLDEDAKAIFNETTTKLNSLVTKIKAKELVDAEAIDQAANDAGLTLDHWYAVASSSVSKDKEATIAYYHRVINSIERLAEKGTGETKAVANDLREEAKSMLSKIEKGEEQSVKSMKELSSKMATFFKDAYNNMD